MRWRTLAWMAALGGLFLFRLLFGLTREFFFEDETQIFLMGLRFYATGRWPYFGPDVVWTKSEIPGALQALLVGLPLRLAPIPEAPFVLLNLLSFGALALFSWYVCRRLPGAPRWLVWGWFLTIPWTLQFSTHVINPSYVLPASLLFFVGFFEAVPAFSIGCVGPAAGHFLMGAALTWIMQVHLSWPLLLPYVLTAWLSRRSDGAAALALDAAACAAGALLPALFLIPTLWRYGPGAGSGGTLRNLHPHAVNPWVLVTTLGRFLSFPSLEISRFIGTDGAKRIDFFQRHLWLAPMAVLVWAAGIVQPIWMFCEGWRRTPPRSAQVDPRRWRALRGLVAGTVLLVYGSYWLVMEPAQAHAFYVLAPSAFLFAAYCWMLIDSPRWRVAAAGVLTVNILFHAGLAATQTREQSLYKNRAVVAEAIRLKQPEMFAHRRPFAIDAGPYWLQDPARPYDARRDIAIVQPVYVVGPAHSLRWQITLQNRNRLVAFRDVLYLTTYRDGSGAILERRHEFIKDVFEPGAVRRMEVNDGFVRAPFTSATIEVAAAEALRPTEDH